MNYMIANKSLAIGRRSSGEEFTVNFDRIQNIFISYSNDDQSPGIFIMELLSFGNNMEVVKPKSLVNKIKSEHQKAFQQY